MFDGEIMESASSGDATSRWFLRNRPDGLFEYSEYSFVDLVPEGLLDGYWNCSLTSGLFATAEAARVDALNAIPWLPGQL